MKWILFLGIIIALSVFGFKKCTADGGLADRYSEMKSGASLPGQKATKPAATGEVSETLTGVSGIFSGDSPTSATGKPLGDPLASEVLRWGRYRFQHRDAPDQTVFAEWSTFSATVVVDPISDEVVIRGPESVVDAFLQWCKAADLVPNSCAVHAWTIYVDQSVQKGWDLIGAIRAVSDSSFTAEVGDGGITLDLGVEHLQAALLAIADGTVVEVVQNPFVRLVDGSKATIESIQELPVPEAVLSNGVSQTSIKFRKVGLQLNITPAFRSLDRVSLDVAQTNGVVGAPVTIEGNEIPVVESQTVSSRVDLKVGETVVLGGVRTFRNRRVKGILRNITEKSEGALYVVLSTSYDAPKAQPVTSISPPLFGEPWVAPVPGGVPIPPAGEWIDGQLLPPPHWEDEEKKLIQSRK